MTENKVEPFSTGCAGKPDGTPCPGGGICVAGECYYPHAGLRPATVNPCAGQSNGTRLDDGGVCWNGQSYYPRSPQRSQ